MEIDVGGAFSDDVGLVCESPGPTGMFGAVVWPPPPLPLSLNRKIAPTIRAATTGEDTERPPHAPAPPRGRAGGEKAPFLATAARRLVERARAARGHRG